MTSSLGSFWETQTTEEHLGRMNGGSFVECRVPNAECQCFAGIQQPMKALLIVRGKILILILVKYNKSSNLKHLHQYSYIIQKE